MTGYKISPSDAENRRWKNRRKTIVKMRDIGRRKLWVVCRTRSMAEFIAKLGVVIEEAGESVFWLEIPIEAGLMKKELVKDLLQEASEITAIMAASSNSASRNKSKI